jgi:hypothetical protein
MCVAVVMWWSVGWMWRWMSLLDVVEEEVERVLYTSSSQRGSFASTDSEVSCMDASLAKSSPPPGRAVEKSQDPVPLTTTSGPVP